MENNIAVIDSLFSKVVNATPKEEWRAVTDFVYEVTAMFKLYETTFSLTLSMLNTFLTQRKIAKEDLQLAALACSALACSLNDYVTPEDYDFVSIADSSFSEEQLQKMKLTIVTALKGRVRILTVVDVLYARLYEGILEHNTFSHAKNIALLLYMYYPKYFAFPMQRLADVCINTVEHLTNGKGLSKEVINDVIGIQHLLGKTATRIMTATLALFEGLTKDIHTERSEVIYTKVRKYKDVEAIPHYKELEELGSGSYGNVYKVRTNGTLFALKKQKDLEPALIEISILMTYKNEVLINVHEFRVTSESIDLYMDLGQSLDKLIFRQSRTLYWEDTYRKGLIAEQLLLPKAQRERYIIAICKGVMYLHSHGIIHRDIKAQNIILVDDIPRIADFGTSLQMILSGNDQRKKDTDVFTFDYKPVELLFNPDKYNRYSFEVDVWALACVVLELLTGVTPFYSPFNNALKLSFEERLLKTITEILGTPPESDYPDFPYKEGGTKLVCIKDKFVRETVLAMLDYRPKSRLSAQTCYERFLVHY